MNKQTNKKTKQILTSVKIADFYTALYKLIKYFNWTTTLTDCLQFYPQKQLASLPHKLSIDFAMLSCT